MTPAYKEALKTKGEDFHKQYFAKEKSLLEGMLVIFMWLVSMMHEQIEWQTLLLWIFAFVLMSRVWSISFGAITLFVALGVYIGTPYETYYMIVFFSLIFTALFTLISASTPNSHYSDDSEEGDMVYDISDAFGDGGSGGE